MPTAIFSLHENENAFVDYEGRWTGGCVPAFLRRYPFVFARSGSGDSFTL